MKYYYKMLFKMYRYMLENYSRDEFLCETRKGIYKLVLKKLQKHFGMKITWFIGSFNIACSKCSNLLN